MVIDLTKGFGDFPDYKLFKFPGGEIHFVGKVDLKNNIRLLTRLNTADDILALCIIVDTIRKERAKTRLTVQIPYIPYQQADRNFSSGESFSLKTITNILNGLNVDDYILFDPHSDVAPGLLNSCEVVDNSSFIANVLAQIYGGVNSNVRFISGVGVYDIIADERLVLLCPDAGAYKKIFKLAKNLHFKGEILCCQKYRNTTNGELEVQVPTLPAKDVLIIDDICVGGRTFIEIAKKIKIPEGCLKYLAISHGIFSNGFTELEQNFDKIFTTNSRQESYTSEKVVIYKVI